jgi:hypothetical protein
MMGAYDLFCCSQSPRAGGGARAGGASGKFFPAEGARVLSRARTMLPTHTSFTTSNGKNGSGDTSTTGHDRTPPRPQFEAVGPDRIEVPRSRGGSRSGSPAKPSSDSPPSSKIRWSEVDGENVSVRTHLLLLRSLTLTIGADHYVEN